MTRTPRARARNLALGLTALIALAIGVLSLIPLPQGPDLPGTDKTHHLIAYGALVLPLATLAPRSLLWLVPLALAYGGAIELIQPFTGRFGEWLDLAANGTGLLLGAGLGLILNRVLALGRHLTG